MSKTSDKSKKTPGKKFVLSIAFAVLLMRLINTREVKCFSWNPNWLLDKIIFSVGYLEIRYMLYVLYVAVGVSEVTFISYRQWITRDIINNSNSIISNRNINSNTEENCLPKNCQPSKLSSQGNPHSNSSLWK